MNKLGPSVRPHSSEPAPEVHASKVPEVDRDVVERAQVLRNIYKIEQAQDAGHAVSKPAAGETGTALMQKFTKDKPREGKDSNDDASLKFVGVYKPGWSKTPWLARLKNFFKWATFGQLSKLPFGLKKQPQAETAAYLLDRAFDLNVVPPTEMRPDGGAFQLSAQKFLKKKHPDEAASSRAFQFGDNLFEAKDADVLQGTNFDAHELNAWQNFIIHDYLCGNLDSHNENYFIRTKNGKIADVVGIDKANSFPIKDIRKGSVADKNRYLWRNMAISQHGFTPEAIDKMKDIGARFAEVSKTINRNHPELEGFLDDKVMPLAQLRAKVLGKAAERAKSDPNFTPAQLAEIRTRKEMEAFLQSSS